MNRTYDAIIIGAGIIGCATSLALGRKGWKVLNLDRLPAAGQLSGFSGLLSFELVRDDFASVRRVIDALRSVNTFALLQGMKVVGLLDARIF